MNTYMDSREEEESYRFCVCDEDTASDVLSLEDEDENCVAWPTGRTGCMKRKLEELDLCFNEPHAKRESRDIWNIDDSGLLVDCERYSSPVSTSDACSTSGVSSFLSERISTLTPIKNPDVDIHFFVKVDGRTIVLHASAKETIELVLWKIYKKTGIPISEQRLIYFGRQLQDHQTLAECQVSNDATLHLVARMLSTPLHRSWQLVNDLVATIHFVTRMTNDQEGSSLKFFSAREKIRENVKLFLHLAAESEHISDHMHVFQLAGATSALVILLLSPIGRNQDCAEDCINLFVNGSDDCISDIHCYYAPVLLDFCKLLSKSAPCHVFYRLCRNSLACILDTIQVVHQSIYFNGAKAKTIVHDFAPFVAELVPKLSSSLCFTSKLFSNIPPNDSPKPFLDAKEAYDFAAFIAPLCKAMKDCGCLDVNISKTSYMHGLRLSKERTSQLIHDTHSNTENKSAHKISANDGDVGTCSWLFSIFYGLLNEIDDCLEKVESTVQDFTAFCSVLLLLKGLNSVAQTYKGCTENLLTVLSLRRKAMNMIIQQSRSQYDNFWLLDHKFLLEFESKKKILLGMFPEPHEDFEERHGIFVKREHLLSDSMNAFENAKPDILQGGLSVEFTREDATGPGVLREWFNLICREIINHKDALFLTSISDARRIYPNPASAANPEHLNYFRFCGQVIALALMHKVQVDVVLALIFFKQIARLPITWEDVKDADPLLYEGCKKILEMDAELVDTDVLGLTFVREFEEHGSLKTVELCLGGAEIAVTSKNRFLYVEKLVQHQFVTCVEKQIECFRKGFSDLFIGENMNRFLQSLEPNEFDLILFGKDRDISIDDWKSHTEYCGYKSSDCHISWFWEVVQSMTMEQRRQLLFFSTSVSQLPTDGFAGLPSKFYIHKAYTDVTWLPTAHTCFFQLILPPYPSFELMHSKLYAVVEGHVSQGFGFA